MINPLQRAICDSGYSTPTPIQEQTITPLLAGRDVIGCAQTGTGKTAAFALPTLEVLSRNSNRAQPGRPRGLILAPTRELAAQIGDSIDTYGCHLNLKHTVIFGGVKQNSQTNALRRGPDILIATPGRLLDLMQQGHVSLKAVEIFILDEADRMLDMGFLPDIRKIIATLPAKRQTVFFSATMAKEVTKLANTLVNNAVHVTIAPEQPTVERIKQSVYFVDKKEKFTLLKQVLKDGAVDKVVIFSRTKHGANRIAQQLSRAKISATAIHGDKSQNARTKALDEFKRGRFHVLVATDIAARGIDIDQISHVINYDLPNEPESYVHRIGRTARAGADGDALSFCSADERDYLRSIERLIKMEIPVERNHDLHSEAARIATGAAAKPPPRGQNRRNNSPAQASGNRQRTSSRKPTSGRWGGKSNRRHIA
ncbi:DEAD/DEAH box helicase [bacterium F16]|nr:DEAD/DEAH box helicase [bacterium F16]